MFSSLKLYAYGGALIALLAAGTGVYFKGYASGKDAVLSKLAEDRITLLKDGKEIDEKVLSADDSTLCVLLGGCEELSDNPGD